MLTRGQVAKRLGKSVATVRRLEGRELHPRRDTKGVLRFDPEEVEAVAEGSVGGSTRSDWLEEELAARECDEPTVPAPSDKLNITAAEFEERVRLAAAKLVHGPVCFPLPGVALCCAPPRMSRRPWQENHGKAE
jgi:hypothetical protein